MLVLGQKLKWTFFSLLLIAGLTFIGLTVFCGLRTYKLQKEIYPNSGFLPDEQDEALCEPLTQARNDRRASLNPRPVSNDSSEENFGRDAPNMVQEERVFNLHGQGRPITGLSGDYNFSGNVSSSGKVSGVPSNNLEY